MPVIWSDATRAKLLMAIIKTNGGKIDYKGIVEFMGPEYNSKCIQNQIQFLKTKANAEKPTGSAPSTPSKNGKKNTTPADATGTPTKSPASAKRGRKQAINVESESASDGEGDKRVKKVKTEVKQEIKSEEILMNRVR
ncbi:uncharacterized protein GIQ15_00269 [Arthroderma uncinatum]|uniref:uncharacterized protein n=1 Tax=Arthroderma uncinatum TaxID=74035 RepID=UPI00144AC23C|nr:uncharacterized protein GIQ15_00269 [Arthroderma uncinatum]KAF3490752.1 hypothetical protein GIQ15_00269 [Arthroderma uncinatum]